MVLPALRHHIPLSALPGLQQVAKIHEAITLSWDVWQPADVARRMHHLHLDKDVSRSLLNLLSIPDDNFEELQRLRQRRARCVGLKACRPPVHGSWMGAG